MLKNIQVFFLKIRIMNMTILHALYFIINMFQQFIRFINPMLWIIYIIPRTHVLIDTICQNPHLIMNSRLCLNHLIWLHCIKLTIHIPKRSCAQDYHHNQ